MSRRYEYLHSGLARLVAAVAGLIAAGLLLYDALMFGWCAPGDCAWSHAAGWSFAALAVVCLLGVILTIAPGTSSRVRVGATVVTAGGLLVGAVVWTLM